MSSLSNKDTVTNLVPISICNLKTRGLVDTGAHISIISQACLNRLSSQTFEHSERSFKFVNGVGDNIIPITDCVLIPIQIGTFHAIQKFHVLQDTHDVILGWDFLKEHNAGILPGTGLLEIGNISIDLVGPPSKSYLTSVSRQQVLKQNEVTSISVKIKKHPSEGIYTFEPAHLFSDQYPTIDILPSVFDMATGNFQCSVVNNSGGDVLLDKGVTLGLATSVLTESISENLHTGTTFIESITVDTEKTKTEVAFPLDHSDLSPEQISKFNSLISHNRDAFAVDLSELGCTLEHHTIDTGNEKPVSARHYRQSQIVKQEMDKQIDELLRLGFIESSTSLWRSPVCMVKKKDNSWRFAIDYRAVNNKTVKISWPLPRLEDVWDNIGQSNAKYFSTLDCGSAFWQIPLDPATKHKTSFVTPDSQYQFKRLPFGLSAAPICFQRAMSSILHGLSFVIVYIDDLIIFSDSVESHLDHLSQVFDRLKQAKFTLKPVKCEFFKTEVTYLGHVLTLDGIKPKPENTDRIKAMQPPTNVKQLRRFLGMANFYRKFVVNYSQIISPLTKLLRHDSEWHFSDACRKAFQILKDKLVSPPLLAYPNPELPYILTTDASDQALSYVLSQKDSNGHERPICYGGRGIRKSELIYPPHEKEVLAVLEGVRTFHVYLTCQRFTIVTDNMAVSYIKSLKLDKGRLARYAMQLQSYDYEIIHRPGKSNWVADALSRETLAPELDTPVTHETYTSLDTPDIFSVTPTSGQHGVNLFYSEDEICEILNIDEAEIVPPKLRNIRSSDLIKAQKTCTEIGPLYHYLLDKTLPEDAKQAASIVATSENFCFKDNLLFHNSQPRQNHEKKSNQVIVPIQTTLEVPLSFRPRILMQYHDSLVGGSHQGFDRTYNAIKMKYHWNNMYADTKHYTQSCTKCQKANGKNHVKPAPLQSLPVCPLFSRWHIDFVGPLTESNGYKHVLVLVESFSRVVEAFPTKDQKGETVARILYDQIITRYGTMRTLVSDNGPCFTSDLLKELTKLLNVKQIFTTPYNPTCNSPVERWNRFLKSKLRTMANENQSNWPDLVRGICMSHNGAPGRAHGYAPFELLYGQSMNLPIDTELLPENEVVQDQLQSKLQETKILIRDRAVKNSLNNQAKSKAHFDKNTKPLAYKVNDLVMIKDRTVRVGLSTKLKPKWKGPYKITKDFGNQTYSLENEINQIALKQPTNYKNMTPYIKRQTLQSHKVTRDRQTNKIKTPNTDANVPSGPFNANQVVKINKCFHGTQLGLRKKWYHTKIQLDPNSVPVWYDIAEDALPADTVTQFHTKYNYNGTRKGKRKPKQ